MGSLPGGARKLAIITLLAILFGCYVQGSPVAAQAQPDDGWSVPLDLAAGRPGRALFPTILADRAGGIHVFWTEEVQLGGGARYSVVYAYGDGNGWAGPVDVFVGSRAGGSASDARAVVDDRGLLHTVWSDDLGVMYAQRHVSSPVSARSWASSRLLGGGAGSGLREIQIARDGEGTLHVVFSDSSSGKAGVYYAQSADQGRTWTAPRLLSEDVVEGRFRLHLLPYDGALHLALQAQGAIHYLRSDDGGNTWPTSLLLEETGSWPQLVGLGQGRLLLLTVGSIPEAHCVKLQTLSADNGDSWEATDVPFLPARGCLGNALVQQDSAGKDHLVLSAYLLPAYAAMIWHTVWEGERWQPVELLQWPERPYRRLGTQPDFPSAGISAGNSLHVLFMVDEGRLWYTHRKLAVAALPPVLYPAPTLPVRRATMVAPTPTRDIGPVDHALVTPPPEHGRSALLFLLPALAALVVVSAAILWERRQ